MLSQTNDRQRRWASGMLAHGAAALRLLIITTTTKVRAQPTENTLFTASSESRHVLHARRG
jgi:hypothetical protein